MINTHQGLAIVSESDALVAKEVAIFSGGRPPDILRSRLRRLEAPGLHVTTHDIYSLVSDSVAVLRQLLLALQIPSEVENATGT